MKKQFAIFSYLYGIAFCLLGLGSGCTAEDEQMVPATVQTVQVQLEVQTRTFTESRTASRVPTDDTFLKTLRIYAFDETGKRVGHFYSDNLPAAASNTLRMDLRIPETPASDIHTLTFYAVGNEQAMSTPGAEKPLTAQTSRQELDAYTFTQVKTPYSTLGLPMYAQATQSVDLSKATSPNPEVAGHEGHLLLLEKVSLTLQRPFGRMGLFVAKAYGTTAALTITGAKMLKEGTRLANYLMPQTDSQKLQQIQSMGTDIPFLPNGPSKEVTVTKKFPLANPTPEERKNTAYYEDLLQAYGAFYPFENPYGSTDWTQPDNPNRGAAVQLDYSFGGDARSAVVYLPPIERNKYYAVCCLINNTGRITVTYVVADWDDVKFELNFEYPTYGNPIKRWNGQKDDYSQPTVYYHPDADSEQGTFSFEFSITEPIGQTWQPTLLDASAGDYELKVFQTTDGKEKEMSPPYLASPDPYRIRIRALDVNKENHTVRFAIAYTPIWDKDGTSLLMINGASGKTYWTGSENPVEVKFTQIAPPQTNP